MSADGLFGEAQVQDVSFEEMLACVDRELAMRRKVYPRWVRDGKLTQVAADLEVLRMRAVRALLLEAQAMIIALKREQAGGLAFSMDGVKLTLEQLRGRFPERA